MVSTAQTTVYVGYPRCTLGYMSNPTITVKADRDLIEQLRELAKINNRSLAGELRTALEQYIAAQRKAQRKEKDR